MTTLLSSYRERANAKAERKELPVAELIADPSYQRDLSTHHVEELRPYDEWRAGAMQIGRRPDGSYAIIDGQHRIGSAERDGVEKVLCLIKDVEAVETEAEEFDTANITQRRLVPLERYKALRRSGSPMATEMDEILARYDGHIGTERQKGDIMAVKALIQVYEKYGAIHFEAVVRGLKEAFGTLNYETVSQPTVSAFDVFARGHSREAWDELTGKLSQPGRGLSWLFAHAGIYRATGQQRGRATYLALVELHNIAKKKNRIEPVARGGLPVWSVGVADGEEVDA